ncbi:hypothetical protein SAMN04490357_7628 [Streptomyces misionensis]|uniref:Uncharacterized protein n=1 Tax=Streptomyces misionensis TaxID=67331 RepID=A0A1H5HT00_9ACTN|nr:hypothetical protein SAMN04490357_7628 [Streptomyces misionensis]
MPWDCPTTTITDAQPTVARYLEAVSGLGELIAIKQAELTPAGRLHRYSWEHLEDEHGFLTDQALDPEEDPLEAIPAEEFQRVWTQ